MPFLKRARTWFKKDSAPTSECNGRGQHNETSSASLTRNWQASSSGVQEPESMLRVSSCPSKQRPQSTVPAPHFLLPKNEPRIVHEGAVKRTKFTEKCKKNWSDCYLVLTSTSLMFYKDLSSYLASNPKMKKVGLPASPAECRVDLVLSLNKLIVDQCKQMHTRRHTRTLVVKLGSSHYLMQYKTEENARWWHHLIQRNIYQCIHQGEFEYVPMELESPGVNPPASRLQAHKNRGQRSPNQEAGDGANVDTAEVSLSRDQIKRRLTKFFEEHPRMEHFEDV